MALVLCFFFLLISYTSACCVYQSKVSYTSNSTTISAGACGYGSSVTSYYGSHLAASIPSFYDDGGGCGACFQIRCKNKKICTKQGTRVVITDVKHDNKTDFLLSNRAFRAMANKGMDKQLLKLRVADVEYKRVHCHYKKNLAIRVEESTRKPEYLAVKFLYQGGKTEILGAQVAQVNSPFQKWTDMSRNHGAVFDIRRQEIGPSQFFQPSGPLRFRIAVTQFADVKWIHFDNELPANWKVGDIFDMGCRSTTLFMMVVLHVMTEHGNKISILNFYRSFLVNFLIMFLGYGIKINYEIEKVDANAKTYGLMSFDASIIYVVAIRILIILSFISKSKSWFLKWNQNRATI